MWGPAGRVDPREDGGERPVLGLGDAVEQPRGGDQQDEDGVRRREQRDGPDRLRPERHPPGERHVRERRPGQAEGSRVDQRDGRERHRHVEDGGGDHRQDDHQRDGPLGGTGLLGDIEDGSEDEEDGLGHAEATTTVTRKETTTDWPVTPAASSRMA